MMLIQALATQLRRLNELLPRLREAMDRLDDPGNLSLPQAVMLAAATFEIRPEVVLDLGTGGGNSATAFGLASHDIEAKVYTFDLNPAWEKALKIKLAPAMQAALDRVVMPVVGDISTCDFAPIIGDAEPIIVFWDAHGYAIAERILAHLMPLIADRRHVVICHDMSDSRLVSPGSYEGKAFWRGVDGAHENPAFGYATIGTVTTRVEQAIPIIDFCWRNGIDLGSFDWELHRTPEIAVRTEVLPELGLAGDSTINMMYFTLNETSRRFFPGFG